MTLNVIFPDHPSSNNTIVKHGHDQILFLMKFEKVFLLPVFRASSGVCCYITVKFLNLETSAFKVFHCCLVNKALKNGKQTTNIKSFMQQYLYFAPNRFFLDKRIILSCVNNSFIPKPNFESASS